MEFVDSIADPSRDKPVPLQIIVFGGCSACKANIFISRKSDVLKINCKDNEGFKVNGVGIKLAQSA